MTHVSGNPAWQDGSVGGTPLDAAALENIELALDAGGGGWWSGFPVPPAAVGNLRQTSPFLMNASNGLFTGITAPIWMPGPQTFDSVGVRVAVAGSAGETASVYYAANVAGAVPDRSTATLWTTIPLSATGRSEVFPTALAIPSTGMWFWLESASTGASVRQAVYVGPNANWAATGSPDAGSLPIGGATATNPDLGHVNAPALFFHRSA